MKKSVLAIAAAVPLSLVLAACGGDDDAKPLPTAVPTPTQSFAINGEASATDAPTETAAPEASEAAGESDEIVISGDAPVDNGDGTFTLDGEVIDDVNIAPGGKLKPLKPQTNTEKYTGGYTITEQFDSTDLGKGGSYKGPAKERAKFAQYFLDTAISSNSNSLVTSQMTTRKVLDDYLAAADEYTSPVALMNSCGGLRNTEYPDSLEKAQTTITDDGYTLRVEKSCVNPWRPVGERNSTSTVEFDIRFDKGDLAMEAVRPVKGDLK